MYTDDQLKAIACKFEIAGDIQQIKPLGPGFINDTLIVKTLMGMPVRAISCSERIILFSRMFQG